MIVNVIHCDLPKGKAAASTTKEDDVYIITVQRALTGDELRKELKHELSHIVNGDFHIQGTATNIEKAVRCNSLTDEELSYIDFYHHYL
nr:MAG TPA: IrrE N-terminal-like domain [Caudoviricetes sp.]